MARRQAKRRAFCLVHAFIKKDQRGHMQIDFDKMDGLAPAIVQEDSTGEVLMVGFMNAEAFARTSETGYVTFYSRTRQKLWMKGETSGNRLRVISALTDCDRDTILVRVFVEGDGLVCHTGTKSCFTEPLPVGTAGGHNQRNIHHGDTEARRKTTANPFTAEVAEKNGGRREKPG